MRHNHATGPDRLLADEGPDRRRYHRDAMLAVLRILGTIDDRIAAVFAAIIKIRGDRHGPEERTLPLDVLAAALDLDRPDLRLRLLEVDHRCAMDLSINMLDPAWRHTALAAGPDNRARARGRAALAPIIEEDPKKTILDTNDQVLLSTSFVDLLDRPHPLAARSALTIVLDGEGRRSMTIVSALAQSDAGAHLAIRRPRLSPREASDLAGLVEDCGSTLIVLDEARDDLMAAILRVELHAVAAAPIVLVERDLLMTRATINEDWDEPTKPEDGMNASDFAKSPPAWLTTCRGVYLWSVPQEGALPALIATWIGGSIGPFLPDPVWSRSIIADHVGTAIIDASTSAGVRALSRRLGDPRDAGAIVTIARAMTDHGVATIDDALTMLASSFSDRPPALLPAASRFDPRLLVCGSEAHRLLERAREAASNGARVLAHGPPGGGKSSYVRELAARMAGGGPVRIVTPADFLARAWGKTERLVRELWRRADEEGEILIADEFEAVGGRRVPGDMSNNQLLIRSLTDAWLTALDDFPGVPLLVTTNDPAAIDPALARRFAFVLEFVDQLSPRQERLAWMLILDRKPSAAWQPCGAAVADVVLAAQRCKMLGLEDHKSFEDSIETARTARLGIRGASRPARISFTTKH